MIHSFDSAPAFLLPYSSLLSYTFAISYVAHITHSESYELKSKHFAGALSHIYDMVFVERKITSYEGYLSEDGERGCLSKIPFAEYWLQSKRK